MKKRFLENLSFFLAINLLIKTVYVFGIDRVVQNRVGAEEYGGYFPLFNLVLIFQIILDMGIENFTRKEVAHNPILTRRLFAGFLNIKIILAILFIGIFSILGLILPHTPEEYRLLVILLINQVLANFILYLRANIGGLQQFKSESIISVLDRAFMVLLCGALLIAPSVKSNFQIEWFVYSQSLAYIVTLLISIFILHKKIGRIKLKWNLAPFLHLLRKLRPYAILALLMAFYLRIDSVFLRYLLPDGKMQAGIYAHGFRILDFMSNYALIFALILLPTFSKMLSQKENVVPLLRMACITLLIPSISFLAGVVAYRTEVFDLLYNEHIELSANVFCLFTVSYIGICFSYTFGALLTANGNLYQLNVMAAFAVVISIVCNSILIPRYQVMGAAIANAITQTFTIVFHVIVTKRKFSIKPDYKLIFRVVLFVVFSITTGFILPKTKLNWVLGMLSVSIITVIFAFSIRLLKFSNILELFNNKTVSEKSDSEVIGVDGL